MKSRPILFSAPMVRAILAGEKTQTRRVVKRQALDWLAPDFFSPEFVASRENGLCPFGYAGDQLWVKEAIARFDWIDGGETSVEYVATPGALHDDAEWVWKPAKLPGMFMPRGLSRITLEITDVRVQRLQEIRVLDALWEGIDVSGGRPGHDVDIDGGVAETFAIDRYRQLWESINGAGSWALNPWVWAISFRRLA